MDYVVSGLCEVAGVAPGGTVSEEALHAACGDVGANIPALIEGGHIKAAPELETPPETPASRAKPPKDAKDAG